jgi:hypothetical protein
MITCTPDRPVIAPALASVRPRPVGAVWPPSQMPFTV